MMRIEKSLDGILKGYVFGALDSDTRLALEERVVTEPEVFDALGVVEDDLIEAYLEGTLPDSQRRAFEQHFMACADRRRQVSFIRMLKQRASASADLGLAADDAFVPGMVKHLKAHPWWAGAIAAGVVALVGGNLWFAMDRYGSEVEMAREVAREVASELAHSELAREVARAREQASIESRLQPPPVERVVVPVPTAPAAMERVGQPAGVPPRRAEPPTFALVAGLLRGEGTTTRVAIPGDAETIRLLLEVQAIQYPLYRVALLDAGGEELWTLSKLKLDVSPRGAFVIVVLPSAPLAPGDYQARLSGHASPGQWNDIATYTFRVTADPRKPRFK